MLTQCTSRLYAVDCLVQMLTHKALARPLCFSNAFESVPLALFSMA